jgi:hypothetical protein
MKILLPLLMICSSPLLTAQDINFKGAAWDSLAPTLNITPFYLTIKKPLEVKSVSVEIDLYVKGALVKTFSSGGFSGADKAPLQLNHALHFMPPKDGTISVTTSLDWGGSQSRTSFSISESTLDGIQFLKGFGCSAMTSEFDKPGRWPVFNIISGTNSFINHVTVPELIRANPDSIVLIGYVKAE